MWDLVKTPKTGILTSRLISRSGSYDTIYIIMGRNCHELKYLWAEMVNGQNDLEPHRTIFSYNYDNITCADLSQGRFSITPGQIQLQSREWPKNYLLRAHTLEL